MMQSVAEPTKHTPANYQPGSIEWLAACVLEDRKREAAQRRGAAVPWYFFFPQHPAVQVMLEAYKRRLGVAPGVALSDMERTVFELQMLSEEALDSLVQHYAKRKQFAGAVRRVMNDGLDFEKLLMEE